MASYTLTVSVFSSLCLLSIVSSMDQSCANSGTNCTPLTRDEKQAILDLHNELRDRVAGGGLESAGHPAARDMNALVWDDGLENVAQAYAESCPGLAHNGQRGISYLTERNAGRCKWGPDTQFFDDFCSDQDCIYIGENVIAGGGSYDINDVIASIESGWFDEYHDWTFGNHNAGCAAGKLCGHYTQMVWANTRYIGCGYSNGCGNGPVFVCNYWPAGNFNSVPPYEQASSYDTACSNCMSDRNVCKSDYLTRSANPGNYNSGSPYNALCGSGLCATMCDGGSYNRNTCNGYGCDGSGNNIDCMDGTDGNNGGRDICGTNAPTPVTPSPVTAAPTAPTTAPPTPSGPPGCVILSNYVWSGLNGDYIWDGSSLVLGDAAYKRDDNAYNLEAATWPAPGYALKRPSDGAVYGYCDQSVITDCVEGTWYNYAGVPENNGFASCPGRITPCDTPSPTTSAPTTKAPTMQAPTTQAPTTKSPTTKSPTTQAPTTKAPTTKAPTTLSPTTKTPTTQAPTTKSPTTRAPTTKAPTTKAPTTRAPTTKSPTTQAPTTKSPTTKAPTTRSPTTRAPTTKAPTTNAPTTRAPTTLSPTTRAPTTQSPTTRFPTTTAPITTAPITTAPTTRAPTTRAPTTRAPTTGAPTTQSPTTRSPTTRAPTTLSPTTRAPTTRSPTTRAPTTRAPTTTAPTTKAPTTRSPTTIAPITTAPTTRAPTTRSPTTQAPTTKSPTTRAPTTTAPTTRSPTTNAPTTKTPTTQSPTTRAPTTRSPTTKSPTTQSPTTQSPTTRAPTTQSPTTMAPTTKSPTTKSPTTGAPTTNAPTTKAPTTQSPTTKSPTTTAPTTMAPTTMAPTTQSPSSNGCPTGSTCTWGDCLDSNSNIINCALSLQTPRYDRIAIPITQYTVWNRPDIEQAIINEAINYFIDVNQVNGIYEWNFDASSSTIKTNNAGTKLIVRPRLEIAYQETATGDVINAIWTGVGPSFPAAIENTLDGGASNVIVNDEQQIDSPLISNDHTSTMHLSQLHIMLIILSIVIVIICFVGIGVWRYKKSKNEGIEIKDDMADNDNQEQEEEEEMETIYFENMDNEDSTQDRGTPIGENMNAAFGDKRRH